MRYLRSSLRCSASGCSRRTSEQKPFCEKHVDQNPHAALVLSRMQANGGPGPEWRSTPTRERRARKKKDLEDLRVGSWLVGKEAATRRHPSGGTSRYWHCTCDCGTEAEVHQGALTGGTSRRCHACGSTGMMKTRRAQRAAAKAAS